MPIHSAFDPTARQCGLLLDEWTEVIPASSHYTGIDLQLQPSRNEAPQTILLVTPARTIGAWQWDDLVGALNETLDLAKIRAVEPIVHRQHRVLALPASNGDGRDVRTASSISTMLSAANGVFELSTGEHNA